MQKIYITILILILNNIFISSVIAASEIPSHVRIGLEERYKQVNSIEILNKSISVGYNQYAEFNSGLNFMSDTGFTVKFSDNYFVKVGEFRSLDEAVNMKDYVEVLGFKAAVAIIGQGVYSVFIGEANNQMDIQTIAGIVGGTVLPPADNRIELLHDRKTAAVFDNDIFPQISPLDGGLIMLDDRLYRGILEIGRYSGSKLTAVNILPVNEYLYSVVPAEMPASWEMEALKAQAVLAGNYVWQRTSLNIHNGYNLCDTSHCQRYLGAAVESSRSTDAVVQVQNIKMTYNGGPIEALYFSSSGGFTANSEDVWSEALSYLRAVEDKYENEYVEWTRTFTLDELAQIAAKKNINIGDVIGLSITQVDSFGRVNELTLRGIDGIFALKKEDIRNFFNISEGGSLHSRNFVLLNGTENNASDQINVTNGQTMLLFDITGINILGAVNQSSNDLFAVGSETVKRYSFESINLNNGNEVVIRGRGSGHGVGMSQHGAKGMAEAGFTFYDILKFYFSGVEIS